jgi:hypothetical protein
MPCITQHSDNTIVYCPVLQFDFWRLLKNKQRLFHSSTCREVS